VLIEDLDSGRSVTNEAATVVSTLSEHLDGGLRERRLYYRDTMGRYDELKHSDGQFVRFAPCSQQQQGFLSGLTDSPNGDKRNDGATL